MAPPPKNGNYIVNLTEYLRTKAKLDPQAINNYYKKTDWTTSRPWNAEQFPLLADWLKLNEKPLKLIVEGVARPRYYNPLLSHHEGSGQLMSVLLPVPQECRGIAMMLVKRAMWKLDQGQLDEAWADILACHRLARHVGHGGTMIEMLVASAIDRNAFDAAIRLMQSDKATPQQLQTWLADLRALQKYRPLHELLNYGERLRALDVFQLMMRDPMGEKDLLPQQEILNDDFDWPVMLQTYNGLMNRTVEALRFDFNPRNPPNFLAIARKLNAVNPKYKNYAEDLVMFMSPKERGIYIGELYYRMLNPLQDRMLIARFRAEQIDELEQLAFGLALHKKTTSHYPKQLDELKLDFVPTDLYTDKPLFYKRTKAGYKLRSLGPDRKPSDDDIAVTVPITKPKWE